METNFIDRNVKSKPSKKTVFISWINQNGETKTAAEVTPKSWKNVEFLFTDGYGKSFFKCWDEEGYAYLYIGERGDEFDEQ